jgi:hypothetical protein
VIKFRSSEVAELLGEYLRYRELRDVAPTDSTLYRRIYDIMHGKTQTVSLSVFDQLCVATGHLEWLQIIEPI